MSYKISLIICTHNPRPDYLQRTLDGLKAQTLAKEQWELLLVDNASTEPLASKWDLSWHPRSRHVREDQVGLTAARLRGIREANNEVLLFVDDDNILDPDYCRLACHLLDEFPLLGCIGAGVIEPEYESKPQEELSPYLPYLALRNEEKVKWSNTAEDGQLPYGAGMAIRRNVAEAYFQSVTSCQFRKQLDRSGQAGLNSGGDDEFSWVACELNLGKGVFPELRLKHLIASRRLEKSYLLRLEEGMAFSHTLLEWLHDRPLRQPTSPRSSFRKVAWAFSRLRLSDFFYEGNQWWNGRNRPAIEMEFEAARNQGINRALTIVRQNGQFKNGGSKGY